MRPNSPASRRPKTRKPLDAATLEALGLHYVGRYATSRAKLVRYLERKLYERGWDDASSPDVAGMAERFAKAGYIDDSAYAAMRARDLTARGYGEGRLKQRLYADGIAEDDGEEARSIAAEARVEAALAFAARRRLGPYATEAPSDEKAREKALSAMIRAGHAFALAKRILALEPGAAIDPSSLSEY